VSLDRIAKLKQIKAKHGFSYEALGEELGVHPISVFRLRCSPKTGQGHKVVI